MCRNAKFRDIVHLSGADLNFEAAQQLIDWLVSERGQALIGDFKISNKTLFVPNAAAQ